MAKILKSAEIIIPVQYFVSLSETNIDDVLIAVRRHIDGGKNAVAVREYVCEYCLYAWETEDGSDPDMPKGQPVCCEKAVEEWRAKQPAKAEPGKGGE